MHSRDVMLLRKNISRNYYYCDQDENSLGLCFKSMYLTLIVAIFTSSFIFSMFKSFHTCRNINISNQIQNSEVCKRVLMPGEKLPPSTLQLVQIYFDTATFDDIERDKKIKTEAQLSLIGGTMGLLTGFSIISGVEIVFFLIRSVDMVALQPQGRSPKNGTVISGGCQIKVTSF